MKGPVPRAESLDEAIRLAAGDGAAVASKRRVGGGDINAAALLELQDGRRLFLKVNRRELAPMFRAESLGLAALGDAASGGEAPPVPEPLAWGVDGGRSFLVLEHVASGAGISGAAFGRALAALHRDARSERCGFDEDNYIGSTGQPNPWTDSWHRFFAEHRIGYQWDLARKAGFGDAASDRLVESVMNRIADRLPDVDDDRPSLIHGDLWGGNWMAGTDGRAWLIDPAAYYGHREADLAMTELFGGFPAGFRSGYRDAWALEPGYEERRDLYNLYHLLNHLNLFGSSYWSGVIRAIRRYA